MTKDDPNEKPTIYHEDDEWGRDPRYPPGWWVGPFALIGLAVIILLIILMVY